MSADHPDLILFAQHGWADDSQAIRALADRIAPPGTQIIAPSLGYVKTWLRIEPLIRAVEAIALAALETTPHAPVRIIGHSMGGLIWLEVLHRHPEWWSRVQSLVLVASPVGGADLARILDPWGWGIGIARDLGVNRRPLAEVIAARIPTLSIAGDIDTGSDGTVTIGATQFRHAQWIRLEGLAHAVMKNHPAVAEAIQAFWEAPQRPFTLTQALDLSHGFIEHLHTVPGMVDAHPRDFPRAQIRLTCRNGYTLRVWRSPLGVEHVFVADPQGTCLYAGFIGWQHRSVLQQALRQLETQIQT